MLSLIKNLHKKYKEIEPYNLLLGFFGIGGGSIMTIWGSLKAASSPIVNVLGKELSFIVGATLIILFLVALVKGFLFFKEFLSKDKKSDFKKSETTQLVEALAEVFNPKDLAKRLSNNDIQKLANGIFDSKTLKFKYNTPLEIPICKKDWNFEKHLGLILPELSKSVNIKFVVKNKAGEDVEFKAFVKNNNSYDEVSYKTKKISYDLPINKEIEFYFEGIAEDAFKYESFLLIESITFNDNT